MKEKTPHNSTTKKQASKKYNPELLGNWLNDISLLMQRINRKFTEELAIEWANLILQWSEREDAWDFAQFCEIIGIPRPTFEDRIRKFECTKVAMAIAKQRLGERRQRKATFGKADPGMVRHTLHMYHQDWEKVMNKKIKLEDARRDKEHAHQKELKEMSLKEAKASERQVVVIERFPEDN